jgi:two-component system sensor histidine kinase/response regulator
MTKILVIEDERAMRENICETLELEGFAVLGAENGYDGVDLPCQHIPDIVICDVMMPRMDGYSVLVTLRSEPQTAMIPLIFLTAKSTKTDMKYGMELGADDYLTKPFMPSELLAPINTRLQQQSTIAMEYKKQIKELREGIVHMLPHELRSPLVGLLGYSELLERDSQTLSPSRVAEMARAIRTSGQRLHDVIEKFLI